MLESKRKKLGRPKKRQSALNLVRAGLGVLTGLFSYDSALAQKTSGKASTKKESNYFEQRKKDADILANKIFDETEKKLSRLGMQNSAYFLYDLQRHADFKKLDYVSNKILLSRIVESKYFKDSDFQVRTLDFILELNNPMNTIFDEVLEMVLKRADVSNPGFISKMREIIRMKLVYSCLPLDASWGQERQLVSIKGDIVSFFSRFKSNSSFNMEKVVEHFSTLFVSELQIRGKKINEFGHNLKMAIPASTLKYNPDKTVQENLSYNEIGFTGSPLNLFSFAEIISSLYPESKEKVKILDKDWTDAKEFFTSQEYLSLGKTTSERLTYFYILLKDLFGGRGNDRFYMLLRFMQDAIVDPGSVGLKEYEYLSFEAVLVDEFPSLYVDSFVKRPFDHSIALKMLKFLESKQYNKNSNMDNVLLRLIGVFYKNPNPLKLQLINAAYANLSPKAHLILRDPTLADKNKIGFSDLTTGVEADIALQSIFEVYDAIRSLALFPNKNISELAEISAIVSRNLYFSGLAVNELNIKKILQELDLNRKKYGNLETFGGTTIMFANNEKFSDNDPRFGTSALQASVRAVSPVGFEFYKFDSKDAESRFIDSVENSIVSTKGKLAFYMDGHGQSRQVKTGASNSKQEFQTATSFIYHTDKEKELSYELSMERLAQMFVKRYMSQEARNQTRTNPDVVIFSNCQGETLRDFSKHYIEKMRAAGFKDSEIPTILGFTETEFGQLGYSDYSTKHYTLYPTQVLNLPSGDKAVVPPLVGHAIERDSKYNKSNPTLYLISPRMFQLSELNSQVKKA